MGRGEASQHPRNSSHHLRHSQPHGQRDSYEISDDRSRLKHWRKRHKDDFSLAEPKEASQAQTRYDIVENWLEQNARQRPHPEPSRSQGHRGRQGEVVDSGHLPRHHDATSPYNKHSRHADPGWRPRHVFPTDSLRQSGPLQGLSLGDARKSTRRWDAPSDSSFISGFENSTMPLKHDPEPARRKYGNIPPVGPLGEAGLEHLDASSTTSHIDEPVNFEKRPRRKTREDRYETGKKKRHRGEENDADHGDHQKKKRKRSEKKKSMASSKNVVNNFTSGAVLNDRITVQPHLKPGLFDNGRTSKKQPISDLAFSEMQFLKHEKRSHQPKALSKSRLREKRREDREMEEVSTFFLPPRADRDNHKPRRQSSGTLEEHVDPQRHRRRVRTDRLRELSESSPSNHRTSPKYSQIHRDEIVGPSSVDFHGYTGSKQESDKNTTYFTWSTSSRHSPLVNTRGDRTSPNISGSVWTSTPEPIRREIIATGVFRDTGIPAYDDRFTGQGTGREVEASLPDAHCMQSESNHRDPHHTFNKPLKVKYRDQAMMTDDPSNRLDQPERNSFTPEWRREQGVEYTPLDDQTSEDHQRPRPQEDPGSPEVDRQRIARELRLASIEKGDRRQNSRTSGMLGTQTSSRHQSPNLVDTQANLNQEKQRQGTDGRASVASRDAMPPPPIPPNKHHSTSMAHASNQDIHRPGQNSSSINAATAVSQTSPAERYNGAIRDTHELTQSCNPPSSSFKPSGNVERTLPSLDTRTWVPQRTMVMGNRSIPSRLSINSPIYVYQLEGDSSGSPYRRESVPKSHMPESMAEFIARIEGESQLQSEAHDLDIPDSGSGQDEINSCAFSTELIHDKPSTYGTEEEMRLKPANNLSFSYPNSGNAGIEQQAEDLYSEARHSQYGASDPGEFCSIAPPPVEDLEERSEMMSFWRPNQYSWF